MTVTSGGDEAGLDGKPADREPAAPVGEEEQGTVTAVETPLTTVGTRQTCPDGATEAVGLPGELASDKIPGCCPLVQVVSA